VLCERGGPLAILLAESTGWTQVYADKVAVIFIRPDHPRRADLERGPRLLNETPK
jgi:hypothetical protein